MEEQFKKSFILNVIFVFFIFLLVYFGFKAAVYLMPIIIAVLVAALARRFGKKLAAKTKMNENSVAILLVPIFYIAAIAAIVLTVFFAVFYVNDLLGGFEGIVKKVETFFADLQNIYAQFLGSFDGGFAKRLEEMGIGLFKDIGQKAVIGLTNLLTKTVRKIPRLMLGFIVSLVAGCYIAKDFERWKNFLKGVLSEKILTSCRRIKKVAKESASGVFKAYFKLWFLTFCELFFGLLVIGVKHPFVLALLIAFVDLLPIIGTGTVLIPWALTSLLTGQISMGAALLILYLLITVIRNFLEPKILSKQMGVNSLVTLVAMFLGLKFFGFLGLITLPFIVTVFFNYYKEFS